MRSHAALGHHPLHPALIAIPIGAFLLALIADIVVLATSPAPWAATARLALIVGIVGALLAAIPGFIDYATLAMSAEAKRSATWHMALNLTAVVLFAISLWLRSTAPDGWSLGGFVFTVLGILLLSTSGWIGGELVFKHRLGVVEPGEAAVKR